MGEHTTEDRGVPGSNPGGPILCKMRKDITHILILIVLVALLVIILLGIVSEPKEKTINVKGKVDYEGIPEPELFPIEGFKYHLIVSESDRNKVKYNEKVTIVGNVLNPSLEEQEVEVTGIFVEDYQIYRIEHREPISSADPQGPVIIVESVRILV